MFANDTNRAPLKTRILFSALTTFFVILIDQAYDYYGGKFDPDWTDIMVYAFIMFTVQLIVSYFFLKTKK